MGSVQNSDDLKSVSERLYVDLYFRLLKSKDNSSEVKDVLRDLYRQLKLHCNSQNIHEGGEENLQNELYAEYCAVVDSERKPGMLSICDGSDTESEGNFHNEKCTSDLKKKMLSELNSYLSTLKINKSIQQTEQLSQGKMSPNVINQNKLSQPSTSLSNKFFQPKSSSLSKFPQPSTSSSNKMLQFKSCGFANKRAASETKEESSGQPLKRPMNKWRTSAKTWSKSEEETPKPPGFMSAKSMYKNPLLTAQNDNKSNEEKSSKTEGNSDQNIDESLKHFDKKIVEVIFNEIMDFSPNIKWTDIAGLDFVKTTVQEIVIWPLLRPDIFTGLRAPPRGILLFGPPGTGKTLIGKCIATESNSTFFCISASSLASKWVGESEQMVRALFTVANLNQPAVIFIDEIDSLLSQRSDKEQDFTRKLKTEFLVQFDGAKTSSESRVLVVGATNRPHELDEAARRRFVKRLYVPLPEKLARLQIVQKLLIAHQHSLSETDLERICTETEGYSGSDVAHLCKEAAMGPIRSIGPENIKTVSLDQVRPIGLVDFLDALRQVRASVAQDDLNYYLEWNKKFGSFGN